MYAIKGIFRFVTSPVLHESVRFEIPLPGHCKSLGVCVSLWRKSTNANPLFPIAIVHRSQRTIRDTFAWIELRRRVSVQWRNWRECDGWKSRTESLEFRREKRPSVALLPFVIRNEILCGWKPSAETRLQPRIQRRSKIPWETKFIEYYGNNWTFVRYLSILYLLSKVPLKLARNNSRISHSSGV